MPGTRVRTRTNGTCGKRRLVMKGTLLKRKNNITRSYNMLKIKSTSRSPAQK